MVVRQVKLARFVPTVLRWFELVQVYRYGWLPQEKGEIVEGRERACATYSTVVSRNSRRQAFTGVAVEEQFGSEVEELLKPSTAARLF